MVIRNDVHPLTNWLRVTLDGVEIDPCFECDPVKGYVLTVERTPEGYPIQDGSSPVKHKLKKLTGDVQLSLHLSAPPHINQDKAIADIIAAAKRMRLESFESIQRANQEVLLRQGYINIIMALYQKSENPNYVDVQAKNKSLLRMKTPDLITQLQASVQAEYERLTARITPVIVSGIQ